MFKEPCARERRRRHPSKSAYFTDIGSSIVKTVANTEGIDMLLIITSTGDDLF